MNKVKLENIFNTYDEQGNIIETITSIGYQLTPDEGKCFIDSNTNEKIIRASDGKGAVIQIDEALLDSYIEVKI